MSPTVTLTQALLLGAVALVTTTVLLYSRRFLHGHERRRTALALMVVAGAGTAVLVLGPTLWLAAAGWTVAGTAFVGLLAVFADQPGGGAALRRTALAFAAADAALWAAVVLLATGPGVVRVEELDAAPAGTATAAVLLVLAALVRCAQVPFGRWLPATIAAPSPVSALLHAGIVNGGGILLVRTHELVGVHAAAMALVFTAGAVTAVWAAGLMLVRPDTKGSLVHSTAAQMGFMTLMCGVGAWPLAVTHLAGHALYKSAAFLNAGGAVGRAVRRAKAPAAAEALGGGARMVLAASSAGLAATATAAVVADHHAAVLGLLGATTGAVALQAALRRVHPRHAAIVLALGVVATAAYTGGAGALGDWLTASAGAGAPAAAPQWLLALPAVGWLLLLAARHRPDRPYAVALYRRLLAAAWPASPATARRPGATRSALSTTRTLSEEIA